MGAIHQLVGWVVSGAQLVQVRFGRAIGFFRSAQLGERDSNISQLDERTSELGAQLDVITLRMCQSLVVIAGAAKQSLASLLNARVILQYFTDSARVRADRLSRGLEMLCGLVACERL